MAKMEGTFPTPAAPRKTERRFSGPLRAAAILASLLWLFAGGAAAEIPELAGAPDNATGVNKSRSLALAEFETAEEIWPYAGAVVLAAAAGLGLTAWAASLFVRVRRKQRKLHETTARLQALIDTIPGVVYRKIYTPDGSRIVWVSDAVRDILGISPADVYNLTQEGEGNRLWHPDDVRRMPTTASQIPADGLIEGECRYVLDEGFRHLLTGGVRLMLMRERVIERKGPEVTTEGILMDVTERKQVEAELRRREYEIRTLVENAPDCIARYDRDCRRVYANLAWSHLYGFAQPGSGTAAEEPLAPLARLREAVAAGKEAEYDVREKTGDGTARDFNVRLVPEFGVDGAVESVLFVARDITARKEAELELHRREEEARVLIDNSPDKIIRYDRQFRRVYINSASQWDSWGEYVTPLNLGETPLDASTALDPAAYIEKLKEVFATGKEREMEVRERRKNQGVLTAHVRMVPEFGPDGTVETVLAVGRNITELKESQRMLSHLADVVPGVLHTYLRRPDGSYAMPYASAHLRDLFGVGPEEVADDVASTRRRVHPDDSARLAAALDESARTLAPLNIEYRVRHPEKGELWVEVRSVPERQDDGSVLWHGFVHDITARKKAELETHRHEQEFRALVEHSSDLIVRYDRDLRRTYVNPAWFGINSLTPDVAIGSPPDERSPLVDVKAFVARLREVLATGKPVECETEVMLRTGEIACFHNVITPEFDPHGDVASILVVARDITELKASQRLLTRLSETSPGAMHIFELHPDGTASFPYASQRMAEITGLGPDGLARDAGPFRALTHPDDVVSGDAAIARSARDLTPFHMEFRIRHPLKGEIWVEVHSAPERQPDGGTRWYGFMHDITARKEAEARLAEREEEFHTLAENIADVLVRYDRDARIVYANSAFRKALGVQLDEVRGKTPTEVAGLLEADFFEGRVRGVIRTGSVEEFEHFIAIAGGGGVWGMVRLSPEFDADGAVSHVQVVTRDINERKKAELELHRREQEIRALVENSPDSIVRYDRECRRVYVNSAWTARRAPAVSMELGKTPLDQSPLLNPRAYFDKLKAVFATGREQELEIESRTKFGEIVTSHVRMAPEFGPDGAVESVLAVGRDVTEMKKRDRKSVV